MVGIQGIGGIPEPANNKQADGRDKEVRVEASSPRDGLEISQQAQEASNAARLVNQAMRDSEIRAERVAEAKAKVEQGAYRVQEIILQVAARLSALTDF